MTTPILTYCILGWGVYLAQHLTIPVVNNAVGGESSRSYSEHGRFTTLVNAAKKGDFVIIEFGHNDASAGAIDNGKQSAVGDGYDITATVTTAKCVLCLWSLFLLH
jgi:rhamnogalacturonan acetylesterase